MARTAVRPHPPGTRAKRGRRVSRKARDEEAQHEERESFLHAQFGLATTTPHLAFPHPELLQGKGELVEE